MKKSTVGGFFLLPIRAQVQELAVFQQRGEKCPLAIRNVREMGNNNGE